LNILITGGTGFIGHNLVGHLAERHHVSAPSRSELDLLDADAVNVHLTSQGYDVVIHAATDRVTRRQAPGPELFERTCRMFFNVARNWHAFGRMLFLGSGAVYDRAHWRRRMPESYFDTHVPADRYGFAKYVCARAIDGIDRVYELRLFGVFGPYEDWQSRFISNACCRAMWGIPIVVGQNVSFDYLDVADLCVIVEKALDCELRYRHYNICTGAAVDLKTIANHIKVLSGKDIDILVKTEGVGNEYSGDNTRLLSEVAGFTPRGIDDSLRRLYKWYEARKDTIDPALLRFDG
jgi:GDP-L-fucose synthase